MGQLHNSIQTTYQHPACHVKSGYPDFISINLGQPQGRPIALFNLIIEFLCHAEAEAEAVDEAGLLVYVAEMAGGVDDLIFSLRFRQS